MKIEAAPVVETPFVVMTLTRKEAEILIDIVGNIAGPFGSDSVSLRMDLSVESNVCANVVRVCTDEIFDRLSELLEGRKDESSFN